MVATFHNSVVCHLYLMVFGMVANASTTMADGTVDSVVAGITQYPKFADTVRVTIVTSSMLR